ncbi:MAG: hypothetical protein K2P92_01405 [Bdellovibrionaceae bacterium]|nr:hypothetical protein [Pseudobdellovibrionaceae bacterium]
MSRSQIIKLVVSLTLITAIVSFGSYLVLKKLRQNEEAQANAAPQEQFSAQAESSQQLQSECQASVQKLVKSDSLKKSFEEYKRHVDNCREIYFSIEPVKQFRNEGMYPDIVLDMITIASKTDHAFAVEMLKYAQTLAPWQLYMGPIVCESKPVLQAYEESLNVKENAVCLKIADIKNQLEPQLRNKNFAILSQLMPQSKVAWLGSPEADIGCPEKFSNIVASAVKATQGPVKFEELNSQQSDTRNISFVYKTQNDDDSLVLEFGLAGECLQFQAALIPGLQTNE